MRLLLPLVLALAAPAAPARPADPAAALRQELDARAARGEFSGAVLLAKGDEVVLRAAYGMASREEKRPNTPETRFNLGSINKAFTRLAIEQLARAGKLSVSDTLDRWVPGYPVEKGRRITLEHLLEHRGGTGDVFGPKYDAADRSRLRTLRDWMPLIADTPLAFEPGSREEYSNAGYILLGLVIEKASGQSYDDYVSDHVFAPAGMKDTGAMAVDALVNAATGYTRRGGGELTDNRRFLPARGSSAGGGYSTLDDLFRFAQALRSGTLGPTVRGGMGVAGGAPGVNAVLEVMPEHTLVVLANLDPPAAQSLARFTRELLGDRDEEEGEAGPRRRRIIRPGGEGPSGPPPRARRPDTIRVPDGGVEVPMLRSGHLPAVRVNVNGQGPFVFAIDTGGAGAARIDQALAARLGLQQVGEVVAGDPSGRNTRTLPVVAVDTIELGGATFRGLDAAVRDLTTTPGETVDGILGFGMFADVLLTLDYPANRVRVERGTLPPPNGKDILEFRERNGVPAIEINVAGQEIEADLDTGAQGGIILPEAMAASLALAAPPQIVGRARTAHNEFEIKAATLDGDATLGAHALRRPRVEFQPLFPIANVGARVLQELRITFDQASGRVRVVAGRTAALSGPSRP